MTSMWRNVPSRPATMARLTSWTVRLDWFWKPTAHQRPVRSTASSIASTCWITGAGGFSKSTW